MQKISIIIIHWNSVDLLKKQLECFKRGDHEIIVIDNNSIDSLKKVTEKYKKVKFIFNEHNRGFAFACNQGVVASKHNLLLFLNPDVEINNEQIDQLIKYKNTNNLIAVSPQPKSQNYQKPVPTVLSLVAEFTKLKHLIPLSLFKYKTLTGGCLLINKKELLKIGGWDERFFLWFEDSDLTQRLRNKCLNYGFAPININHLGGISLKKLTLRHQKDVFFTSMLNYAQKHFSSLGIAVIRMIKRKYTRNYLLPILNNGLSITIPNLKKELLLDYLENNKKYLKMFDEIVIVSSSLIISDFWNIKKDYQNIRLILINKNKGFTQTVNAGFKTSTFNWTGTCNDDVLFNSSIKELIAQCKSNKHKNVGSINPIIKSESGGIESAGINILTKGKAEPIKTINSDSLITKVSASNAAFVIYKHKALQEVGLFDEKFGSYLEDIDLSLRLSRKGYKNVVYSKTDVIHKKHASSISLGRYKRYLDAKNWWLVILKNWPKRRIIQNIFPIFIERLRNIWGILK